MTADDAPTTRGTTFVPGGHVALVGPRTIGLIAGDSAATRQRLWEMVDADIAVDDILDELAVHGIKSLPDFAIAQVEGTDLRIVVRGTARIAATSHGGVDRNVDANGVRTWVEDVVADVTDVTMSLPDDGFAPFSSDDPFFVDAGVVPATALTRTFDADDADGRTRPAAVASAPAPAPAPDADSPPASSPSSDDVTAAPFDELAELDLDLGDDLEVGTDLNLDAELELDTEPDLDGGAEEVAASEPAGWTGEPDRSVAPDESEPEPEPDPEPEPEPSAHPDWDGDAVSGPIVRADDRSSGLDISAFAEPAPDPAGEPEPAPGFELDPEPAPEREPDTEATAPHEPVATLSFSNGERVSVVGPVLIGRNPKVAEMIDGELPRIVRHEGAIGGLSRTHAAIRVVGADLVVEDLNSTNGTDVELPGQLPERLPGGMPMVVSIGTELVFGEEFRCVIEPADPTLDD
ncbi:MAG: FHA domain-containing protein [Actinomycetota bacterium]